jgi:hypothetical protein
MLCCAYVHVGVLKCVGWTGVDSDVLWSAPGCTSVPGFTWVHPEALAPEYLGALGVMHRVLSGELGGLEGVFFLPYGRNKKSAWLYSDPFVGLKSGFPGNCR